MRTPTLLLAALFLLPTTVQAGGGALQPARAQADALSVQSLRAHGYSGLDKALATGDADLIDAVAGQRHASASRLFWHMDLDTARAEAARSGKPILSLRLLGDLREEYTCANSRFFRTLLYSHPQIARVLRDEFVLHWSSERDVPVVTIDFGDGRRVRRTITGNSVHYVLDAEGRPLDAIPGVYSPDAFLEALAVSRSLHVELASLPAQRRASELIRHHRSRAQVEASALYQALARTRSDSPDRVALGPAPSLQDIQAWMDSDTQDPDARIPAMVPMMLAVSKSAVERPILVAMGEEGEGAADATAFWVPPQPEEWAELAARVDVRLHPASEALIRSERPLGTQSEDLDAMLEALADNVALDTVRNRFQLRPRIRAALASGEHEDLDSLNRVVYDRIFATPASDPWLGLVDPTAYTALDDAGWESEAVVAAAE